jgi:shikimate kinase
MNIVLIGPRCSGKTSVGRLLAGRTGMLFQDTDALVEAMAGTTIAGLVAARGWEMFRALERQAIAAVTAQDQQVIATGGGAVEDRDNARSLGERGFLVWLDGRPDILCGRLETQQWAGVFRPSLTGEDPLEEMRQVMQDRRRQYERVSTLRVDTSDQTVAEVAETIMAALKRVGEQPHGR